jgi:autotransporter-associated beta strand protein
MRRLLGIEPLERRRVLNAAPVLDATKTVTLSAVAEDAGPPVQAVGIPASFLLSSSSGPGNYSDADGDLPGLAITKTSLQGGRLWYSTDTGLTWRDVSSVSESAPRLIHVEPGTRFFYEPPPNWSGRIEDLFTFRAWDRVAAWPQVGIDFAGPQWRRHFGYAVAISDDGTIAAVADASAVSFGGGQVSVYERTPSGWSRIGEAIDTNGYLSSDGDSVALSSDGRTVVVGTPLNDGQVSNQGNVQVFRWDGVSWRQLGDSLSGKSAGDRTGWAVSISSDGATVAVGSPQDGTRNGYTAVYRWTGTSWIQLGGDINGWGSAGARMGWSVALSADGNSFAVGSIKASPGLTAGNEGLAQVYSWDGTSWQRVGANLWGGQAGDELGWSVALSGDGRVLAAGARYAGKLAGPTYKGQVRLFRLEGGDWVPNGILDGELGHDELGTSVSLSRDGGTLAAGAPGKREAGLGDGHARIYRWDGYSWVKLGPDIDGGSSELLGHAVALSGSGNTVVVGAPSISGPGNARVRQLTLSVSMQASTAGVSVVGRNDRPIILQADTHKVLPAELGDGEPVGAAGTLVSALSKAADNFLDADGGNAGIAITGLLAPGKLWFSIDGGQSWGDVGPVSDQSARLLHADSHTRIYFEPFDSVAGTIEDVVRYRVWDRSGGYDNGASNVGLIPKKITAGGAGSDRATAIAGLFDGASVVIGKFSGTVDFGGTRLTSNGSDDIFVAKIASSGAYSWVTQAGGPSEADGFAIASLPDGSTIITGDFFEAITLGAITLSSGGRNKDIFVAKLDALGEFVWAVRAGGSGADAGLGVAISPDGSSYVAGHFSGTATFGAGTLVSGGAEDVFVAKLDPHGAFLWARRAGGTGSQLGRSISAAADGSAILAGTYTLSATFGTITLPSAGNQSFVAKIDSNGNFLWATRTRSTDMVWHTAVSMLTDGSAVVTGWFSGTATFDNIAITSAGLSDVFVARISSDGRWTWARRAGGVGSDIGYGITALPDGSAVVVGSFAGAAAFGGATVVSNGSGDVFALRIDGSGSVLWSRGFGGLNGDGGSAVTGLPNGSAVVAGFLGGSAVVGSDPLATNGGQDAFVIAIGGEGDLDLWDFVSSSVISVSVVVLDPRQSAERVVSVAPGMERFDEESHTGAVRLVVRGGGRAVLGLANAHTGGTVVEDGELVVRNASALGLGGLEVGANARVILEVGYDAVALQSLSLNGTGRIDVGTGRISLPAGAFDLNTIRQLLASGRNGGTWDGGQGITSRSAGANTKRAVGYVVSGGALTLGWAAYGDLNLDGRVNTTDLSLLTGGGRFNRPGSDSVWSQGDFNYDGRVNTTDISLLTQTALFNRPSYRTGSGTVAAVTSTGTPFLQAAAWYAIGSEQYSPEGTKPKSRLR